MRGISFSHSSGFYESAFDVFLTAEYNDVIIYYTLDGSNPSSSATRSIANDGESIRIDPSLADDRPNTPSVLLRAIGTTNDSIVTEHVAATYIFLDEGQISDVSRGRLAIGIISMSR